jgi:hypothetical protein
MGLVIVTNMCTPSWTYVDFELSETQTKIVLSNNLKNTKSQISALFL